jgi:DNA-directed RNA polymerase specialized sigma24 family protein
VNITSLAAGGQSPMFAVSSVQMIQWESIGGHHPAPIPNEVKTADSAQSAPPRPERRDKGFKTPVYRPNLSTGGRRLMDAIAVHEPTAEAVAALEHWRFGTDIVRINPDPAADDPRLIVIATHSVSYMTQDEIEANCQWNPYQGAGGDSIVGIALGDEESAERGSSSKRKRPRRPTMPIKEALQLGIHSTEFLAWAEYRAHTIFISDDLASDQNREDLASDVVYKILKLKSNHPVASPSAWLNDVVYSCILTTRSKERKRRLRETSGDQVRPGQYNEESIPFAESKACSTDPDFHLACSSIDLAEMPENIREIARLQLAGHTVAEIAKLTGLNIDAIYKRRRRSPTKNMGSDVQLEADARSYVM